MQEPGGVTPGSTPAASTAVIAVTRAGAGLVRGCCACALGVACSSALAPRPDADSREKHPDQAGIQGSILARSTSTSSGREGEGGAEGTVSPAVRSENELEPQGGEFAPNVVLRRSGCNGIRMTKHTGIIFGRESLEGFRYSTSEPPQLGNHLKPRPRAGVQRGFLGSHGNGETKEGAGMGVAFTGC